MAPKTPEQRFRQIAFEMASEYQDVDVFDNLYAALMKAYQSGLKDSRVSESAAPTSG